MKGGTCLHETKPSPPQDKMGTKHYGAALGGSPEVSLKAVLSNPNSYRDRTIVVGGHVRRACSKRGCWMELASDETKESPACRVKFKDYGFLVPTDSQGAKARLEGVVEMTQVKKAAVDHYEKEGATFPGKQSDGTAMEVRIVATGVELTHPS